MKKNKGFSLNWIVKSEHQLHFETVAKHFGLSTKVIGKAGKEIQGVMSPIKVPENNLGIEVKGTDQRKYNAEYANYLSQASQEGILPEGVVLPEGLTRQEKK